MSRTNGPRGDDPYRQPHGQADTSANSSAADSGQAFDPLDPYAYPGTGPGTGATGVYAPGVNGQAGQPGQGHGGYDPYSAAAGHGHEGYPQGHNHAGYDPAGASPAYGHAGAGDPSGQPGAAYGAPHYGGAGQPDPYGTADPYAHPVTHQGTGYENTPGAHPDASAFSGNGQHAPDPYARDPYAADPYAGGTGTVTDRGAAWDQTGWPDQQASDAGPSNGAGAPSHSSYAPQFAPFDPSAAAAGAQPSPAASSFDPQDLTQGGADTAASRLRGSDYDNWYPDTQRSTTEPSAPGYEHTARGGTDPFADPGFRAEPAFGAPASAASTNTADPSAGGPFADFADFGAAQPSFDPHPSANAGDFGTAATGYGFDPSLTALDNRPGLGGLHIDPGLRDAPVDANTMALDPGYDEDEDDETDAPRSTSRRMVMIAGALVGAIAVGGGLMYGYKVLMGGTGASNTEMSSKPPVVRSPSGPSRTRPDNPGGRTFSHTNSKIMDRLGGGAGATATATSSDRANARPSTRDSTGARRVSTISIGPDGSVRRPRPAPTPSTPAPTNPAVQIPGLSVVGGGPLSVSGPSANDQLAAARASAAARRPTSTAPRATAPQRTKPIVIRPPAVQTTQRRVAAVTPPSVTNLNRSSAEEAASQGPPLVKVSPSGKARMMNPVTGRYIPVAAPDRKGSVPPGWSGRSAVTDLAPGARSSVGATATRRAPNTTAAVSTSGGSTGYVAVLASIPVSASSRMEALARFADIQQNYGNVLDGKSPDVREANLGGRGRYHRLMIGPPGSREGAAATCSKLQQAGYSGCWVTPY